MAAYYNDGSVPYGSQSATINSVTYVGENWSVTRGSKTIDRLDANGEPSGRVTVPDFVTGTGTLQLAATTTALPPVGEDFTLTHQNESAVTYIVTEVSPVLDQNDARKVNISFYARINTP